MVDDLCSAIKDGDLDKAKRLVGYRVKYGVDINAKNANGKTPFYYADRLGYPKIVKYLIDVFMTPDDRNSCLALHDAAICGVLDLGLAQLVLKGEMLVNNQIVNVNDRDKYGQTALHWVTQSRCDLDTVVLLAETCKADVNAQDKYGQTPLHFAAVRGSLDVVKYLVEEHKADVNTNSNIEWNALRYAIAYGHLNIVKYLGEKCNVDAIVHNPQDIAEYLQKVCKLSGTSRDPQNITKCSVDKNPVATVMHLHCAAHHGYLDIVKYLVKEYKSLSYIIGDNFKCKATALLCKNIMYVAAKNGHLDIVKFLTEEPNPHLNPVEEVTHSSSQKLCSAKWI